MLIAPQTNIQLFTTPLTADQDNQLLLSGGRQAQDRYFEGLPSLIISQSTYQRKDNFIRVEGNAEKLRQYNYCRYQNTAYSNRWIYAFITKWEYVNENMAVAYLETDVWQTWYNDIEFEPSFIEREHVNDDSVGLHTYPEGLEYGSYIVNNSIDFKFADRANSLFCLQVTDFPSNAGVRAAELPDRFYNGMPSGCYYLAVKAQYHSGLDKWIQAYTADKKADAIISIFPIPQEILGLESGEEPTPLTNNIFNPTTILPKSYTGQLFSEWGEVPRPTTIDGYKPYNNKLLTSPYCYFYFCTNTGSTVDYKFEDFETSIPRFRVYGAVTPGGEYKMIPFNMKYQSTAKERYAYGVTLNSLPLGSWITDYFNNWKALNADGIAIQTAAEAASGIASAISGVTHLDPAGAISSAITTAERIALTNNQITIAKKLPDQARGDTANQTLTYAVDESDGTFYIMSIRNEYAKIIDDFFTMYGYKVNRLGTPNLVGRTNWNYVKTIGANITGAVPQEDLLKIKQIFDKGVTLWHNPENFLNYNVNNDII